MRWILGGRLPLFLMTTVLAGAALSQQLPDAPVSQTADATSVRWEVSPRLHTFFEAHDTTPVPPQRQLRSYDLVFSSDTTPVVSLKPMNAASAGAALCSRFLKKKCQATFEGEACGAWRVPLTLFGLMHGGRGSNRTNRPFPPSYSFH